MGGLQACQLFQGTWRIMYLVGKGSLSTFKFCHDIPPKPYSSCSSYLGPLLYSKPHKVGNRIDAK